MGEPLYDQVVGPVAQGKLDRPCRIYAPVGTHETLLAYLVRRLLENGANTSFVNRIADPTVAIDDLVEDPVATVERSAREDSAGIVGRPHPAIALPVALYGTGRSNSRGFDLASEDRLAALDAAIRASDGETWSAAPLLGADVAVGVSAPVRNPARHDDVVGHVQDATMADVETALAGAAAAAAGWAATEPKARAALLRRGADLLEADLPRLLGLLSREAGKTYPNGVAEVREAVDFLRFYAAQVEREFDVATHVRSEE